MPIFTRAAAYRVTTTSIVATLLCASSALALAQQGEAPAEGAAEEQTIVEVD